MQETSRELHQTLVMTQSNLLSQESTSTLVLAEPSDFKPKGKKAFKRLQSKQDLVEAIGWGSLIWATALFASGTSAISIADKYNESNKENQVAVLLVELDGNLVATSNFSSLLNPV